MTTGDALRGTLVRKVLLNVSKGIGSRRPIAREHFFKAVLCKILHGLFHLKKKKRVKFAPCALISALVPERSASYLMKKEKAKQDGG